MTKNLIQKEFSIKHMVCPRCIESVQNVLTNLGMTVKQIELGKAIVEYPDEAIDNQLVDKSLKEKGFELIEDKEQAIITKIKAIDY